MFKDITDVMLARAYAVDYLFQNIPHDPEAPRRHYLRNSLAWVLRTGGRALTWTGDKVAA